MAAHCAQTSRTALAALTHRLRMKVLMGKLSRRYTATRIYCFDLYNVNISMAISKKEMQLAASSLSMLAQQVRACVSARPLQPSVWRRSTKPRRSPDVASSWEREQGCLPRIAACGVTVEVALRHTCHAGGGSRGVDEELDRRSWPACACCVPTLHRRRPFGEVLGWRAR